MSKSLKIPEIGAEVWIEPGQTNAEIDHWFKTLSDHKMPCARLFIIWNYIEIHPDLWDFSLYDQAFDAASKYGVKIQATLTANHGPSHSGTGFWYHNQGGSISTSRDQLTKAERYIRNKIGRAHV
jgi:hypothetical protein